MCIMFLPFLSGITPSNDGVDDDATADVDFPTSSIDVTFEAGETAQSVNIPVVNDLITDESDETFTVTLVEVDAALIVSGMDVAELTIQDDDGKYTLYL